MEGNKDFNKVKYFDERICLWIDEILWLNCYDDVQGQNIEDKDMSWD